MNTDMIREFVDLAETLNFTETARRCYITQPVLSKHIASLEKELGVRLFERDKRHVRLTDAGKAVLVDARAVSEGSKRVLATARRYHEDADETIVVGYLRAAAENTVPIAHARFREACPKVDIIYRTFSYYDLVAALADDDIDIAIGAAPVWAGSTGRSDEYRTIPLFEDRPCIVMGRQHPLSALAPGPITANDLEDTTILTLPTSTRFSDKQDIASFFEERGVPVKLLDRFDNLEKLPLQLATEDCVAILPSHVRTYFEEAHMGDFEFIPFVGFAPSLPFEIMWKKKRTKPSITGYARIFAKAFMPPTTIDRTP